MTKPVEDAIMQFQKVDNPNNLFAYPSKVQL